MRIRGKVGLLVAVFAVAAACSSSSQHVTKPTATAPVSTTAIPISTTLAVDPVGSLPRISPSSIQEFHLPSDLLVQQAVVANGAVWLAGYRSACAGTCPSLYRLDPSTGSVTGVPGAPLYGLGIASADSLWLLSDQPNGSPYQVTRVDLPDGHVRFTVPLVGSHVYGNTNPIGRIAVGSGAVWVNEGNEILARLDPQSGRQLATITMADASNGLAVNAQGLWAIKWGDTAVMRVEASTNSASVVANFGSGFAQSIAADQDAIWTTHYTKTQDLVRIDAHDPRNIRSTGIPTADVTTGDGAVWFLGWMPADKAAAPQNHFGLVGQIDPVTLKIIHATDLPINLADETQLIAAANTAWVIDSTKSTVWRIKS